MTARFSHPHIVTIYAVGEASGYPYVALEYLEGQNLRQRLSQERPGLRESARIGAAIADALTEAHAHQIIHWDLKPDNVMLPIDGRLRVVDFGLAKVLADIDEETAVAEPAGALHQQSSQSGQYVIEARRAFGTPRYMAPERLLGSPSTNAVDVWSLGLILFELFSGRFPFGTRSFEPAHLLSMRRAICSPEPAASLAGFMDIPVMLSSLVDSCLSKPPEQRPSARRVSDVLRSYLSHSLAPPSAEASPFRGLLPFTERHAVSFFGRRAEIDGFIEKLRIQPTVPVVGPSGVGKSSFVQAGVIPRLKDLSRTLVVHFRPGRQPFESLVAALRSCQMLERATESTVKHGREEDVGGRAVPAPSLHDPTVLEFKSEPGALARLLEEIAEQQGAKVLVFVDQLEELFSLVADQSVRVAFIRAICRAADDPLGPVRAVFTLRDDFLVRFAETDEGQAALTHVMVLRNPRTKALREIVSAPLDQVGYRFEDTALVDEMVDEVEGEAASLPLVQFACTLLWEERDREKRVITRRSYQDIGGVAGALARHADASVVTLSEEQLRHAKTLFLRLVTPEGTRRILTQSQLLDGLAPAAAEVLTRLTSDRAIVARRGQGHDEPELELVHESLVNNWHMLRGWLDESREEVAFAVEANEAAALWDKRGRRYDEVWQGEALREALRKAKRCAGLPDVVKRFLDAGQRRQRRRALRRRAFWTTVFVLLISGIFIVALKEREATRQRHLAEEQRNRAQQQRAEAQREGARAAFLRQDYLEARAKLRKSLETRDGDMVRALWWRLSRLPIVWKQRLGTVLYEVAYSPDGRTVAATGMEKAIYLVDADNKAVFSLRGHRDQVFSLAFAPAGKSLVSGTWSGTVGFWDLPSGSITRLDAHQAMIWGMAFSPDGGLLATAGQDAEVKLIDPAKRRVIGSLQGHRGRVWDLAFNPGGELLASASNDGTVRLWDTSKRTQNRVIRIPGTEIFGVSFSPDGRDLVTASADRSLRVWDPTTGALRRSWRGHTSRIFTVRYSPDGKQLASGGADATVRLWDAATGTELARYEEPTAGVLGLAFSPDGRYLASGGYDGTLRLWNTSMRGLARKEYGHTAGAISVAFSPDDEWLASTGQDKTVRIWNRRTGVQHQVLSGHADTVYDAIFSPDGKLLASAGYDGTVRLFAVESGEKLQVLVGHEATVFHLDFSPDGKTLASASGDKTVIVWDVATGAPRHVLRGHSRAVHDVAYSPDGTRLLSGGVDRTLRLWDLRHGGKLVRLYEGHEDGVWGVAFSPDGRHIASGSSDKTVRVWDVGTGKGRVVGRCGGRVYWLSFHPDGKRIGAPCSDGTARIWSLDGQAALNLYGHRAEVDTLRFSHNGRFAATASDDGTVRLWEVDGGRSAWRAPLLHRSSLQLLSHRGWTKLSSAAAAASNAKDTAWRQSLATNALRAAETEDLLCAVSHDGTLDIWDLASDRVISHRQFEQPPDQVLAFTDGCVVLTGEDAFVVSRNAEALKLAEGVTAVALHKEQIWLAAEQQVSVYDGTGKKLHQYTASPGITALARVGPWLVLGFKDGNIELHPTKSGQAKSGFVFEGIPFSPVVRLVEGPMQTLVAGFANGLFGIWNLQTGVELYRAKLHGPVVHLAVFQRKLIAASELGQAAIDNLDVFYRDYCELLRDVWQQVPVVWEGGLPVRRPPPASHRCYQPAP